jgi:hypothetical protein
MLFIPPERLLLYFCARLHWSIAQVHLGGRAALQTMSTCRTRMVGRPNASRIRAQRGYESNLLDQIGNGGHEGERSSNAAQLFTQFLSVFYTVFPICLSQDSGPRYMNKCVVFKVYY